MTDAQRIQQVFQALEPVLDERMHRLVAAALAMAFGYGGVSLVSTATGVARSTLHRGLEELAHPPATPPPAPRIRRPGGGRKRLTQQDPTLQRDLEALVEPVTRGDPQSPLRWTCKSLRTLATELKRQGHQVSPPRVAELLHAMKYSLQGNRKTKEGTSHPDRNAQFEQINAQTKAFQERQQPVISVDCKKKELVGEFKNSGQEWHPQGEPETVQVHGFPDPKVGKAIPYGVYDLAANQGWVSVGSDHDTAEFAVASIRQWWQQMGSQTYPTANELLIMADGGGSNSSRARLWKVALQQLADEIGLTISVCHFPPGTSKWNKIEHRMFCHITQNWRGRPLISHEVVVNLIGSTRTATGLTIRAGRDENRYPTQKRVTDEEFDQVQIQRADFHGEWNYMISPRRPEVVASIS
jgi:DDE family transposase